MPKIDLGTLWTIVPVRGLAAGKSRLAPVLGVAQRVALNRELLARTLAVIGEWSGAPQRTIVVSPCARALALARKAGTAPIRDGTRAIGLNRAVKLGIKRAAASGATSVLILPGDLPQLSVGALRALARAAGDGRMVLAPDKAGAGTNALLVPIAARFKYAFGPRSFAAHRAAARSAGLTVSLVRRSDLAFDLDTPNDLARYRGQGNLEHRATGVKMPTRPNEEERKQ